MMNGSKNTKIASVENIEISSKVKSEIVMGIVKLLSGSPWHDNTISTQQSRLLQRLVKDDMGLNKQEIICELDIIDPEKRIQELKDMGIDIHNEVQKRWSKYQSEWEEESENSTHYWINYS